MRLSSQNTEAPPNKFLAALSAAEYECLLPHLKKVYLQPGQILHDEGQPPKKVYFLTYGVAALVVTSEEGKELAISMVGHEGIVGERAVFEGGLPLVRCQMVTAGRGYGVSPEAFKEFFERYRGAHELTMRCIEARLAESSQTALCNQAHTIEQRLSRWLLTVADRLNRAQIPMTQDAISQMLGVRRSGITIAIAALAEAELIQRSRGHITILDATGLEAQSCACYRVTKEAITQAYTRDWQE